MEELHKFVRAPFPTKNENRRVLIALHFLAILRSVCRPTIASDETAMPPLMPPQARLGMRAR
jgi:hypothetical protein